MQLQPFSLKENLENILGSNNDRDLSAKIFLIQQQQLLSYFVHVLFFSTRKKAKVNDAFQVFKWKDTNPFPHLYVRIFLQNVKTFS